MIEELILMIIPLSDENFELVQSDGLLVGADVGDGFSKIRHLLNLLMRISNYDEALKYT